MSRRLADAVAELLRQRAIVPQTQEEAVVVVAEAVREILTGGQS